MCSDRLILLYSFILALNIGLSLTSALVCCVLHAQMKSKVPLLMFAPSQEAGVSTIFVCLDKDPEYLKDRNPRFYQDLACHPTYFQAVMPEATKPLSPNEKV